MGVATVLLTGACGGGEETSGARSPEASPTVRAEDRVEGPVLTGRELQSAVLSGTKIGAGTEGVGDGTASVVPRDAAEPATCGPVLGALQGASGHQPLHGVTRMVVRDGATAYVYLSAYRAEDAGQVMAELRSSLTSCRAFRVPRNGTAWSGIRRTEQLGEGDQELAFRGVVRMGPSEDDPKVPEDVHVVRVGTTIATFTTQNITGTSTPARSPKSLVHEQVTALEKAAG